MNDRPPVIEPEDIKPGKLKAMENINLPPFYVGQKVVRIRPHDFNMVQEGKEYFVTGVMNGLCKCNKWLITVGVNNPYGGSYCTDCGTVTHYHGEMRFCSTGFAHIQSQEFKQVTYSKILEEVPCGAN